MSRLSFFKQASADDLRAVEQWAYANVCSIEHTCSEAVSGLETEAEYRHRIAMQEAAEAHLVNSSAAIVRERVLEEELSEEGVHLRTEEGYLLGARDQFEEQQRLVAAQQTAGQELTEQLRQQYSKLVQMEGEVAHWRAAEAAACEPRPQSNSVPVDEFNQRVFELEQECVQVMQEHHAQLRTEFSTQLDVAARHTADSTVLQCEHEMEEEVCKLHG
jgi:hypothetical protein